MLGGLAVVAAMGVLLSFGIATLPDIDDEAPLPLASLIAADGRRAHALSG